MSTVKPLSIEYADVLVPVPNALAGPPVQFTISVAAAFGTISPNDRLWINSTWNYPGSGSPLASSVIYSDATHIDGLLTNLSGTPTTSGDLECTLFLIRA